MDIGPSELAQINQALETVHNPLSASTARHEAEAFLQNLKSLDNVALIGWKLNTEMVNDAPPSGFARHFGLTLLETAVCFQFHLFDEEKRLAVRNWIVQLAFMLSEQDPHYIREKCAYIWVQIAKRVWGLDTRTDADKEDVAPTDGWVDMDRELLELWQSNNNAREELSLSVLRYLFEDIYLLEDAVAAKRMSALSSQTIEIVSTPTDLEQIYSQRAPDLERLRANQDPNDGWLKRWVLAMQQAQNEHVLLRILETIKTTLRWVPTATLLSSKVLDVLIKAAKHNDVNIRVVACDCLHIMFNTRNYTNPSDFETIVGSIFQPEGIKWLSDVYAATYDRTANVEDAEDDLEYVFVKKLVELITTLGDMIDENTKTNSLPKDSDIYGYFVLMHEIAKHPSLMVSGLVLQFWCTVLRVDRLSEMHGVRELFQDLLETATSRCINYEDLPKDNLSVQYMDIDFDSQMDKTQFFKNYQRYIEDILRLIVCRFPIGSAQILHSVMMKYFETELGWKTMNAELPNHEDPAYIYGCAQFTIVESYIRGISRWQVWASPNERDSLNTDVMRDVSNWATEMLELRMVDLVLARKHIECIVQFAPLLKDDDHLLFKILERVLESCTYDLPPETTEFDDKREKVMELRTASGTELNRLAYMVPNSLAKIYDQLEQVVGNLIQTKDIREHESVSFKSFLLVASQRSPLPHKSEHFSKIVDPVLERWTDENTIKGLTDLEWFMERVGVVQIDKYFRDRGVTASTNLVEAEMDEPGRALKAELKQKWQAIFPIRPSRIFIQYTIERLDHQSPEYLHLLSMWKPRIQVILPHILQLIRQIMAYHNPENWASLPAEVQTFVRTSCAERFWQNGISMQTRDEFESAAKQVSRTLRDFADSVGHIVRYTREYSFLTLGSISQLEETMYEMPNMGRDLCAALVSTTAGITSHAWRHMISLTVRNVVRNCPIPYVAPFLTDFLPPFLHTIDEVLVRSWTKQEALGFQLEENNDGDLSEEMMDEHHLRQLTMIVDRLLIDLVGQATSRVDPRETYDANGEMTQKATVRNVCRNSLPILVEVLRLCGHLMVFKDSRCSFNTCLIVRNLLAGPRISIMEEVTPIFLETIVPAALSVLSDQYFSESHLEIGTILTLMYTQLPGTLAALQYYIPKDSLDEAATVEFDTNIRNASTFRQQRGILMEFLTQCRVLQSDEQSRAQKKKRIEHKVSVRNQQTEDNIDRESLLNMFGA